MESNVSSLFIESKMETLQQKTNLTIESNVKPLSISSTITSTKTKQPKTNMISTKSNDTTT